jgi:ketosteroid isomerase-like protein
MTEEPKKITEEEARANPERYQILASGAIKDLQTGYFCGNIGGKYTITPSSSPAMLQRRRDVAMVAHMRGLSKAMGVEMPDDAELDAIIEGAGNAIEAITAHMAKTFLGSKNLRGMGETFGRLVSPLSGEGERGAPSVVIVNNVGDTQATRMFEQVYRDVIRVQNGEILEGVARDVDQP